MGRGEKEEGDKGEGKKEGNVKRVQEGGKGYER